MWFGVWGLGFGVWGFGVWGLGFMVCGVWGFGGLGGLGFYPQEWFLHTLGCLLSPYNGSYALRIAPTTKNGSYTLRMATILLE